MYQICRIFIEKFQGENVQLQMEVTKLEHVKDNLGSELARLSQETEKMQTLSEDLEQLQKLYQETEAKYQTMLTVRQKYFAKQKYFY